MPLYDYDCTACGHRFEAIHGVHADGPASCPACGGGPVRKAFAAPAIHFKGSGWAKKERRATASPGRATSDEGSAAPASAETGGPSPSAGASDGTASATTAASTSTTAAGTTSD